MKFAGKLQELFYNQLENKEIMLLGTKARYAVMALVDLASRGEGQTVCIADLSKTQDIPLAYLEQLFVKLRKAQLVQSVRGPGGGYTLAKPANKTNIAEIVEAVDEPLKMTRCNLEKTTQGCLANKAKCMTHELWDDLGEHVYIFLQSISLKDVQNKYLP